MSYTCPNCGEPMVLRTLRDEDTIGNVWHCSGEPHVLTPAGMAPRLSDLEQQRALVRAPLNRRNAHARA